MSSSRLISIFNQPPPSRGGPSSIVVSVLVHSVVFVWLYLGLRHPSQLKEAASVRHFSVRVFRQDDIEYPAKHAVASPASQPAGRSGQTSARPADNPSSHSSASAPLPVAYTSHSVTPVPQLHPAPMRASAPQLAAAPMPVAVAAPPPPPDLKQLLAGTRTLIQPDVPPDVQLNQVVPLPTIVKWTPDNSHDKLVILPTPKEATAALAKPTIKAPNRELKPADVKISSTRFTSKAPALPPSTTSPIVVRRPEPVTRVPETAAKASAAPTPVQIVSLSDLQSKQAVIPVPAANSAPRPVPSNTVASGKTGNAPATNSGSPSNGNPATTAPSNKPAQAGAGPAGTGQAGVQGPAADKGDNAATGRGDKGPPGEKSVTGDKGEKAGNGNSATPRPDGNAGSGPTPSAGSGPGIDPLSTRITQPKDGQFGVVIVGSTLADKYPETAGFWSGRLIYTVYLHVGPGKSWILQYSLPRDATPAGAVTRPDAPWPFDMVRPHLEPGDFNSDAIMVHGFIDPSGHFDRLGVVFPDQFPKAKLVLNALQQWQFRPARQNGQTAAVEVLLIIPEETE